MKFWEAKRDFCEKFIKIKVVLMQAQVMKAKTRRHLSVWLSGSRPNVWEAQIQQQNGRERKRKRKKEKEKERI